MAETISETTESVEPVHWYVVPVIAAASASPYWVAVKNEFVVTWFTMTKLYFGCDANNGWSLWRA
jgi:hypothetical protein